MRARILASFGLLVVVALVPGVARAAPPPLLRTLGGPNHAEMYPSGFEVGPDGTIVIADTGNNEVAKYTAAGTQLWRIGSYGAGTNQFSNPRDIGIASDGTVYVADARNNRIVRLNGSNGGWLGAFSGPTGNIMNFPLGVSVHTVGANDRVYVADSGKNRVRVFNDTGAQQLGEFRITTGQCTLSDPRDVDADAAGNLYVANYKLHNIVKLSPTGACLDAWTTGTQTNNTPYGVRVADDPVTGNELVYVALGNEDRIEVWTKTGTLVQNGRFGGDGAPADLAKFKELRRVAVAPDGDVWGADLWGWRLKKWDRTPTGWVAANVAIGSQLPNSTNSAVFHEPRGIEFEASGTVSIVDTVHHKIVRMTQQGAIVSECGGRGSGNGQFNWPRGHAIDPVNGQTWVANTKQYNIHVVNAANTTATGACQGAGTPPKFGTFGSGSGQFNWPHDIAIRASDRIAFIVDTQNHRILSYNVATRSQIAAFGSRGTGANQFQFPAAVALNPLNGHVLVADSKNDRIVELSDAGGQNMQVVRSYTGGFLEPNGVAVDALGRILVADSGNNRVVILSTAGAVLEAFSGPGGLQRPEAIAVAPNGEIYVAETFADRVKVFAPYDGGGSTPDTTPPNGTATVPTQDQALGAPPVTLTGNATDDRAVASVQLAIRDRTSGLWYRTNGTWGAFQAWNATLSAPNTSSTGWTYTWTPASGGSGQYALQVNARDAAGNQDPTKPWVRFTVGN